MAKEKLHHLQQLVKVVQQGGGPHLPIDDLENLTLTLTDEQSDTSEYGEESEEEADEDNVEESENEEQSEDEDADGEQTEEDYEKSETSKCSDMNYNVSCCF